MKNLLRMNHSLYYTVFLLFLGISSFTYSGPWLSSGEPWSSSANTMATKSDIDLLAMYGLIQAPVLTWPIAWDNIGPSLLSSHSKKQIKSAPPSVQIVYFRVLSAYQNATQTSLKAAAFASGGGNINPFRTFEYQPRGDINTGVEGEKQDEHWAAKLAVSYGNYADVTKDVHLDDSYLYGFLGNWALGVDKMPRWWGPAYSDSLILSANAPPLPTLTFQRMRAEAFQSKWLSWIGPWSFTSSLSVGGQDVPVPHPLIWLTNVAFRPIESLQFSASRVAFFAGDTRPLNGEMFKNLLTINDTCGRGTPDEAYHCDRYEPGTEHAEITVQWSPKNIFLVPTTFYLQTLFNDAGYFLSIPVQLPCRTSFTLGANTVIPVSAGYLRLYLESDYIFQYDYWFWNDSKSSVIYNLYAYSKYPYTYYGKIIGSPLGSEAKTLNFGGVFSETNGNSDTFMVRYLQLNKLNFGGIGYPFSRQNVLWLSVGRTFALPKELGQLGGQLAYLKSLTSNSSALELKSSPSGFLTWSKNF